LIGKKGKKFNGKNRKELRKGLGDIKIKGLGETVEGGTHAGKKKSYGRRV